MLNYFLSFLVFNAQQKRVIYRAPFHISDFLFVFVMDFEIAKYWGSQLYKDLRSLNLQKPIKIGFPECSLF